MSIAVATCSDGIRNENETDVDCGGWCAPQKQCADSKGCRTSSDCVSGVCILDICQGKYSYLEREIFGLVYPSSYL